VPTTHALAPRTSSTSAPTHDDDATSRSAVARARDDRASAPAAWTGEDEPTTASALANAQLPPAIGIASLAPPMTAHVTPTAPGTSTLARAEEVQALASAVVERAAVWGDGTRGVARLRLGARASGGLASATIVLEHDGERLRVRVEGASDAASEALIERLRARGIEVDA
jgi:hypothetical protein